MIFLSLATGCHDRHPFVSVHSSRRQLPNHASILLLPFFDQLLVLDWNIRCFIIKSFPLRSSLIICIDVGHSAFLIAASSGMLRRQNCSRAARYRSPPLSAFTLFFVVVSVAFSLSPYVASAPLPLTLSSSIARMLSLVCEL